MAIFYNFTLMEQQKSNMKFEADIIWYRNGEGRHSKLLLTDKEVIINGAKSIKIPITQIQKITKSPGLDTVVVLHTSNGEELYDHIFSLTSTDQDISVEPNREPLNAFCTIISNTIQETINRTLPIEESSSIECERNYKKKTLKIICSTFSSKFYQFSKTGDTIKYKVPILCGMAQN